MIEARTTEEEYEGNPKLNKDDIQALLQWLEKQPHLPNFGGKFSTFSNNFIETGSLKFSTIFSIVRTTKRKKKKSLAQEVRQKSDISEHRSKG